MNFKYKEIAGIFKHTLISFFKALWWPGFICKFLASQTYDFNQIFSVGRENIVLQSHIIS